MKHIVNVTISNPAHEHVSLRRRQSTINYMVEARDEAEAIFRASNHFKKLGHYVHNAVIVEQNINEKSEQIQINEAMQVRAYDKNGKLVGNYRSMADAKKFKPGHNYKEVKEEADKMPVAPVPGDKWKSHAVMVHPETGQRVVVARKNAKNYPESDGWKEVAPGTRLNKGKAAAKKSDRLLPNPLTKKFAKEEVEQIDEISDSLLRRAKNKADYNKMNTNDNATFQKNQDHEDKLTDAEYKRSARRERLGIPDDPRPAAAPKKKLNFIQKMAKNRKAEKEAAAFLRRVSGLHNEEVEQIDETVKPDAKKLKVSFGTTHSGQPGGDGQSDKVITHHDNAVKVTSTIGWNGDHRIGVHHNGKHVGGIFSTHGYGGIYRKNEKYKGGIGHKEVEAAMNAHQKHPEVQSWLIHNHPDSESEAKSGTINGHKLHPTAKKYLEKISNDDNRDYEAPYKPQTSSAVKPKQASTSGAYEKALAALKKKHGINEEVEQIDEALDHEVNKYAQHMLNAHSADDLHVGNEHRDMAHQTLQDIKKNYGPVGVRWANARAGEHIENHNKAQREAEKASVMKRYKPTPPGAKVYQYPKSEVKEDVVNEKAPPGAKYERMVKHIKDKYSEDGTLTPKEKAIAYATAWKAKNSGK
jgi:hypothetical protein